MYHKRPLSTILDYFLTQIFALGCTHNCFMHLKVALRIVLIVIMELSLNRSVKNLNLAALKDRGN